MPFQKDHEYRWHSDRNRPLEKQPICFKGWEGQKESLKSVPNWQERLREAVDRLVIEQEVTDR